ncbi:MAG: hypothetical protein ABJL18_04975 [Hyphomicrobiales bacterium]
MTEWLNGIVGEAVAPYVTFAIALIIVLILIAILFRILKAFTSGKFGKVHQNRLGIIEGMALEGKRRLVIVRRDNVEHLLLIGGENDLVIEQGIQRQAAQSAAMARATKTTPSAAQKTTAPQNTPKPEQQKTIPPQSPPKPMQQPAAQQPAAQQPALQPQTAPKPAPQPTAQASAATKAPVQAAATAKPADSSAKPVQSPPKPNDSAKIKEMEQLLGQLAGD